LQLSETSTSPAPSAAAPAGSAALLGDIFGMPASSAAYVSPRTIWLPAEKGKGLEINGTFARRNGQLYMDMTFTNKAMQPMMGFAIQFNKNSFGLAASSPLQVQSPLPPGVSAEASLQLSTTGAVQKMDPLNTLQVKESLQYFSSLK
jgi:AP-1 complex subunit beta-1